MNLSSRTPPIVSVVARPDTSSAWIRMVGDIDMVAEPALAGAADRLNVMRLRFIVIDLTSATFVCSTFANFLAALHRAHPDAELVLHRPSRLARVIVTVTGMDGFVVTESPPAPSSAVARNPTPIVKFNAVYPGSGDSAARKLRGRWEATNRKSGTRTAT